LNITHYGGHGHLSFEDVIHHWADSFHHKSARKGTHRHQLTFYFMIIVDNYG
jgi:hypothetical protein